jgi:hypothetical protein
MAVSARSLAIAACAAEMCAMLRFVAASGSGANEIREGVMRLLDKLATPGDAAAEQLRWLKETLLNHYDEWPGPKTIRAIWCTRYKPADGIEADLPVSSPLAAEIEQRAIVGHENTKAAELTGGTGAMLLLREAGYVEPETGKTASDYLDTPRKPQIPKTTALANRAHDARNRILPKAIEIFGDREKAVAWMCEPCVQLGHRKPVEVLAAVDGYGAVDAALELANSAARC